MVQNKRNKRNKLIKKDKTKTLNYVISELIEEVLENLDININGTNYNLETYATIEPETQEEIINDHIKKVLRLLTGEEE